MTRSFINRITLRGRIAVLVSTCALTTAGAMALIESASSRAASSTSVTTCGLATLNGTYSSTAYSWTGGSTPTPMASADFEQFNGSGGVLGKATVVGTNGVEFGPFQPTSGTYTLSANCTGTLTVDIAGTTAVFDLYASPSGDVVNEVMTEVDGAPGSPDADTETRVSPSDLIHSR